MNKQIEALNMAIYALNIADAIVIEYSGVELEKIQPALEACKEALAEAENQEPVAWYWKERQTVDLNRGSNKLDKVFGEPIPLYTHPAQPLSEEEIKKILKTVDWVFPDSIKTTDSDYSLKAVLEAYQKIVNAIRAIEKAHGIGKKS